MADEKKEKPEQNNQTNVELKPTNSQKKQPEKPPLATGYAFDSHPKSIKEGK